MARKKATLSAKAAGPVTRMCTGQGKELGHSVTLSHEVVRLPLSDADRDLEH